MPTAYLGVWGEALTVLVFQDTDVTTLGITAGMNGALSDSGAAVSRGRPGVRRVQL